MAKKSKNNNSENGKFVFGKTNYKLMLWGLGIIVLGFILMLGGGSDDPSVFNPEMFSFRRIRLAPTIVLLGYAVEVFAILYTPKKD